MRALGTNQHDMASFWLRKTRKPVLAVLLTQKSGQEPQLFCGTNMEVSMPTGSLCAERNVIGTALAADLTLQRQDIRIVAVLSLTLDQPSVEQDESDEDTRVVAPSVHSPTSSVCSSPTRYFGDYNGVAEAGDSGVSCLNLDTLSCQLSGDCLCSSPPGTPNRPGLAKKSLSQSSVGTPIRKRTVKLFDPSKSPGQSSSGISDRSESKASNIKVSAHQAHTFI